MQAVQPFVAEAFDRVGDGLRGDVELTRSRRFGQPATDHVAHHHLSTFGRQRRILVGVHSVLRDSLRFGDISVHGSNRMDNLLKDHIPLRILNSLYESMPPTVRCLCAAIRGKVWDQLWAALRTDGSDGTAGAA